MRMLIGTSLLVAIEKPRNLKYFEFELENCKYTHWEGEVWWTCGPPLGFKIEIKLLTFSKILRFKIEIKLLTFNKILISKWKMFREFRQSCQNDFHLKFTIPKWEIKVWNGKSLTICSPYVASSIFLKLNGGCLKFANLLHLWATFSWSVCTCKLTVMIKQNASVMSLPNLCVWCHICGLAFDWGHNYCSTKHFTICCLSHFWLCSGWVLSTWNMTKVSPDSSTCMSSVTV